MVDVPIVAPARLEAIVRSLLIAAGASEANADCVAESLVSANLAGHDSHGVQKLPSYVRDIRKGSLQPAAEPRVTHESGSAAMIDGMATFGHVGARLSATLAIAKASVNGIGAVATTHCHHTGRLGRWTEMIADAGLVGIVMGAEGKPPYKVAPFGGTEGALATNPIACAVPRGEGQPPILLDYATSVVSIGKLQMARVPGDTVPPGWILDKRGHATTDLKDFFEGGTLLPFGGYKGYALAVIAELLAGGLSGADRAPDDGRASCLFTLAIDPTLFRPRADFEAHVRTTVSRLKEVRPADAGAEVLVPGEPETRSRQLRANGIPVSDASWQALEMLRHELHQDRASFNSED